MPSAACYVTFQPWEVLKLASASFLREPHAQNAAWSMMGGAMWLAGHVETSMSMCSAVSGNRVTGCARLLELFYAA